MARGWESKSVEEQQAEAAGSKQPRTALSPAEVACRKQAESLQISRKRVLAQLADAQHPRHRQMLEAALAALDEQLRHIP